MFPPRATTTTKRPPPHPTPRKRPCALSLPLPFLAPLPLPLPHTQDMQIPIGQGQHISAPSMHAVCLELLEQHLAPGARALDVGTGAWWWRLMLYMPCLPRRLLLS